MFILLVKMKLRDIFTPNNNKKTNQDGGTWKKKKLKELNVTPKELLDSVIIKPKRRLK